MRFIRKGFLRNTMFSDLSLIGFAPSVMHIALPSSLAQLPIHLLPPRRRISPHRPHHDAARRGDDAHASEKPSVPNGLDQRLRDNRPHAREDVADEVVERDAHARFPRHKFRQHGRCHAEDKHAADAEEEIRDQGHEPEDSLLRRPAVPDERARVQERGDPGVLPHAVLGAVGELAVLVAAVGAFRFAGHDEVGPAAAEDGGDDVADAVGYVGQADDDGGEVVGGDGEGGLQRDAEEVETAEGYGGVVDCD